MNKFPLIIKAMREVVEKGGFGTAVTPVSQFYFQQAFNNVMEGPWKKIAEGYGKMVLGYFGKTPVPPDRKIVRIAAEQLGLSQTVATTLSINDHNPKKAREAYEKQLKEAGLKTTDENVFITASCGQKGIDFLLGKGKVSVRYNETGSPKNVRKDRVKLMVNNVPFDVKFVGHKAIVNDTEYTISEEEELQPEVVKSDNKVITVPGGQTGGRDHKVITPQKMASATSVKAGTPGHIADVFVTPGQAVHKGDKLCTIEVMKMETRVTAPVSGTVTEIFVQKGATVVDGQELMRIG